MKPPSVQKAPPQRAFVGIIRVKAEDWRSSLYAPAKETLPTIDQKYK